MTEWPVIHFKNHTAKQASDRGFLLYCHELYEAIKPKRAEVIEAALSVEGILDMVLLDLLVGKEEPKRDVLRENILFPEFCSSFQKWKMFSRLTEILPEYFNTLEKKQLSILKGDVHKLIEDRNKFAHGDLFVDAQEFKVELRYYQNGTKWITITDDFLNDLLDRAHRSCETLTKLHNSFSSRVEV